MNGTFKCKVGVLLSLFFLLMILDGLTISAWAADRTGYINIQRIVSESVMGKKKNEELSRLREQKDKDLRKRLAEIEGLNNELKVEREKSTLDEKKIRDLMETLQQKNKEVERFAADAREELTKKDKEFVNEILQKAAPILKELGDKGGYAVILKNIEDIAYIGSGVDMTEDVIKRLDKIK